MVEREINLNFDFPFSLVYKLKKKKMKQLTSSNDELRRTPVSTGSVGKVGFILLGKQKPTQYRSNITIFNLNFY